MRLRFVQHQTEDDRRKLKPAVGDTVLFEGKKYKVFEVGMKYVRMHPAEGPQGVYVAKIQEVIKVFPDVEQGGVSLNLEFNP